MCRIRPLIVLLIRSIDGPGFDFAIHSLILNVVILDQSYKLTPGVDEFINAPKEEIRNAEVVIEAQPETEKARHQRINTSILETRQTAPSYELSRGHLGSQKKLEGNILMKNVEIHYCPV